MDSARAGLRHIAVRLRKVPHLLLPGCVAWLRGWYYRLKFFLLGRHFRAGRLLRVYGPLNITGPGAVEFGDDCLIISDAIKPVCIRTLRSDARLRLGDHVGLNGTAIQCAQSVSIGHWSNIADAYITDTPAHSIGRHRRQESIEDVPARPVVIEDNVWVSVQVVILAGVTIGTNSVVGACSLVRTDVPADVFVAGNPLKQIRRIED
jgi:acetyltransferase-like isoleucine patch superfamily enzyme